MGVGKGGKAGAATLPRQGIAFLCVGTIGFLVDASVLTTLVGGLGLGHYGSRVVSFAAAVTVTWLLNRRYTFAAQASDGRRRREFSRYLGVQVTGALINLGVYGALVAGYELAFRHPVLPLAAGSLMALIFTFTASKYFAFAGPRQATARSPGPSRKA